jgi:hypothetical protein
MIEELNFSKLKHVARSGLHFHHGATTTTEPNRGMTVGSVSHFLVFGAQRVGAKPLVKYDGRRAGKEWEAFAAKHADAEIVSASEWTDAEAIADAVRRDPVAQARLAGARFEVPLTWEDSGFRCSTSGIDIVNAGALCDLKTTTTTEPEAWKRHAFRLFYHCQMAWYRRGAVANGIDVSKGLYLLGVEAKPPHAVVELEMTWRLIDLANRTIDLWLSKLRTYVDSDQWPGYAQNPVPWDVPSWMDHGDGEEEDEEAA